MRVDRRTMMEFVHIGELADTTKQLMAFNLHDREGERTTGTEPVKQLILQQARDYLGSVREGFVLSVRTRDIVSQSELGYLLDRVLLDWSQLSAELGLGGDQWPVGDHAQVEQMQDQLLAFGMAAVALGVLPRLPAHEVTFPHSHTQPPTYADIPVPGTPGEMLARIEELEETVWQAAVQDLQVLVQHRYGPLRRTYGFFESSAWLANRESERFGWKRRKL